MEDQRIIELLTDLSEDMKRIRGLLEVVCSPEPDEASRTVEMLAEILCELKKSRSIESAAPADLSQTIDPSILDGLINSKEAKSILKISDSTLYRAKKSELITPVRILKRNHYDRVEIESLVRYFMK